MARRPRSENAHLQRTDFLRYARRRFHTVVALTTSAATCNSSSCCRTKAPTAMPCRKARPGDFKKWPRWKRNRSAEVELYFAEVPDRRPTQRWAPALRALGMRRGLRRTQGPPTSPASHRLALTTTSRTDFPRTSIAVDEEGTEAAAATGGIALAAPPFRTIPRRPSWSASTAPSSSPSSTRPSGCLPLPRRNRRSA